MLRYVLVFQWKLICLSLFLPSFLFLYFSLGNPNYFSFNCDLYTIDCQVYILAIISFQICISICHFYLDVWLKCLISPKWDVWFSSKHLCWNYLFWIKTSWHQLIMMMFYNNSDTIIRRTIIQHLLYSKYHFNIIECIDSLILITIPWGKSNYYPCWQVRKFRYKEF